jgi:DNA-binding GntR family transcriptional regulator
MIPSDAALEALRERRQTSLPAIVRGEVLRLIDDGVLLPGTWVNEAEVSARFGVSRSVVREACRGLEQSGLLSLVVNRGVFVREVGPNEAAELYELRAALFGFAGKVLAERLDAAGAASLDALTAQLDQAAHNGDGDGYYELNLRLHATIFELAGNERLRASYLGCVRLLHLFRRNALVSVDRMSQSNAEHLAFVTALKQGDAALARHLMEEHVLQAKSRVLAEPTR